MELLKAGAIHIAGTHIRDEQTGESNLPTIGKLFRSKTVAVVSFALWEEGIVIAHGNPKSIRSVADFARPDVKIANREKGAGSRSLLDTYLHRIGLTGSKVSGYDEIASGHLPAARRVKSGEADCCLATKAAARVFGLDFLPLVSERYDLVVRRQHLKLQQVQALFETLGRSAFRRELEGLGGYDASVAGSRVL
jgi:molybdate-binding protein